MSDGGTLRKGGYRVLVFLILVGMYITWEYNSMRTNNSYYYLTIARPYIMIGFRLHTFSISC